MTTPFKSIHINPPPKGILVEPFSTPQSWVPPNGQPLMHTHYDQVDIAPVIKNVPNLYSAGLCYWSRPSDGLVLSWDGPHGFNISPPLDYDGLWRPDPFSAKITVPFSENYIGKRPVLTFPSLFTINNLPEQEILVYSYTQWTNFLYVHGVAFPTPPASNSSVFSSGVLGACMMDDTIVIICNDTPNQDKVYFSKLSELSTLGWRTAGVIPLTVGANRVAAPRQKVYSINSNADSFVTLFEIVKTDGTLGDFFATDIVRGSLSISSGVVSVFNITQTPVTHKNEKINHDVEDYTQTFFDGTQLNFTTINNSTSSYTIDKVIAVGFNGNLETQVKATGTGSSTTIESSTLSNPDVGNVDEDGSGTSSKTVSVNVNYTLGSFPLFVNSESENTSKSVSQTFSNMSILNRTDTTTNHDIVQNDLMYLDFSTNQGIFFEVTSQNPVTRVVTMNGVPNASQETITHTSIETIKVKHIDGTLIADLVNVTTNRDSSRTIDLSQDISYSIGRGDRVPVWQRPPLFATVNQHSDVTNIFGVKEFESRRRAWFDVSAMTTDSGDFFAQYLVADIFRLDASNVEIHQLFTGSVVPSSLTISSLYGLVGTDNSISGQYTQLAINPVIPSQGIGFSRRMSKI